MISNFIIEYKKWAMEPCVTQLTERMDCNHAHDFKSASCCMLLQIWNQLLLELYTLVIVFKVTRSTFSSFVRNLCRPPRWKVVLSFNKKWLTCHAGKTYNTSSDVEPGCWGWSLLSSERRVERTSKHFAILTSRAVTFSLQKEKYRTELTFLPFCCMWE